MTPDDQTAIEHLARVLEDYRDTLYVIGLVHEDLASSNKHAIPVATVESLSMELNKATILSKELNELWETADKDYLIRRIARAYDSIRHCTGKGW